MIDSNDEESAGVYGLITKLCEHFTYDRRMVKKLRSISYGILLGKTQPTAKKKFRDYIGITDPMCQLLAWQYELDTTYNLPKVAEGIRGLADYLEKSYEEQSDLPTLHSIIRFLICLRDVPILEDDDTDLAFLPKCDSLNFNEMFKLPQSLICEAAKYDDSMFYMKPERHRIRCSAKVEKPRCICSSYSNKDSCREIKVNDDENRIEPEIVDVNEEVSPNIWEIAARETYNDRKNWENYGYPEPDKEPIFLSELGDLQSLWVENLPSVFIPKILKDGMHFRSDIKSRKEMIRDLKYLLVGMASESFTYNDYGQLILIPGVTIDGVIERTLESYCKEFTYSAECYRGLKEIETPHTHIRNGYIYAILCDSIRTYLEFYRTAVFTIEDDTSNILAFSEITSGIREQIRTVAEICKVGPFAEGNQVHKGAGLLNYLCKKVLTLQDKNLTRVLYALLYPCCQMYFSRFLQPWILHGSVNDPYDEFFIKPVSKFLMTKGRTYWTRSFTVNEDIVPDFLVNLKDDILMCGKTMNLLKCCYPFNKLSLYLMGKVPSILSSCITSNQLVMLEQKTTTYFVEASTACGHKLSLATMIQKRKEDSKLQSSLFLKKRLATIRRLELERSQKVEEELVKKLERQTSLKEQYDIVMEHKQLRIMKEIAREMQLNDLNTEIEKRRERMIHEEAIDMIHYYENLCRTSDERKTKLEKHIESMKIELASYKLQRVPSSKQLQPMVADQHSVTVAKQEPATMIEHEKVDGNGNAALAKVAESDGDDDYLEFQSCHSLDLLNANLEESEETKTPLADNNNADRNEAFKETFDNFERAKRNKRNVMTEQLGLVLYDHLPKYVETKNNDGSCPLNDRFESAKRNRRRVMTEELGLVMYDNVPPKTVVKTIDMDNLTDCQRNRLAMMATNECFDGNYVESVAVDKENNADEVVREKNVPRIEIKRTVSLCLNVHKAGHSESSSEIDRNIAMSVDSTPLSDLPFSDLTPLENKSFVAEHKYQNSLTTGSTELLDKPFCFDGHAIKTDATAAGYPAFAKTPLDEDATEINPYCLRQFLQSGVSIPLAVHEKLAKNELLKYFVYDLKCLKHLENLRNYFFLQDGEFGNVVTEQLFTKLYSAKFAKDLIHCRSLHGIISYAMDDNDEDEGRNYLSFRINSLPTSLHLGDPNIFNCISLTYAVDWPLNILLPSDTMAKYDEIFKFLLTLKRMSWVLNKIFLDLRMLEKQTGSKALYLKVSTHYRNIQMWRHIMLRFVTVLQNYIFVEVLQPQWLLFERELISATCLDEIYDAHRRYVKNILSMCLLNKKSAPLMKVINRIFTVILKFYDVARSRSWSCEEGTFIHPNFSKLDSIYKNFEEFILYLFRAIEKVVKSGCQMSWKQFADNINCNFYYSNKKLSR